MCLPPAPAPGHQLIGCWAALLWPAAPLITRGWSETVEQRHKPASGPDWTIINPGGWELFMRNAKSEHCLETITTIIARGRRLRCKWYAWEMQRVISREKQCQHEVSEGGCQRPGLYHEDCNLYELLSGVLLWIPVVMVPSHEIRLTASSLGGHYSMRSFLLLFLKKPISSSSSLQRGSHFLNLADSCNWVFVNY